jgi:hypothetical protein
MSLANRISAAVCGIWNGAKARVQAGCTKAKTAGKAGCKRAKAVIVKCVRFLQAKVQSAIKRIRLAIPVLILLARKAKALLWQYRKQSLVAAGAGLMMGLCCYLAGPFAASLTAGVSSGSIAGALAEFLPTVSRLIPHRRLAIAGEEV